MEKIVTTLLLLSLAIGCAGGKEPPKTAPTKTAGKPGSGKPAAGKPAKPGVATPAAPLAVKNDYTQGVAAFDKADLAGAAKHFEKAIAKGPRYALPYYGRGVVALRQGRFDEAGSLFKKALSIRPAFAEAHHGLALAERQQGRFAESEKAYLAALKYDIKNPLIHYNLGVLYDVCLDKPDKALNSYREYLKYAGNKADKRVEEWVKYLESAERS